MFAPKKTSFRKKIGSSGEDGKIVMPPSYPQMGGLKGGAVSKNSMRIVPPGRGK